MKKLIWALSLLLIFASTTVSLAQETSPYVGHPEFPAPDFATGLDWINVPAPLTMADLRGKVVLLDFWTYGCINCMHMFPVLKQLEAKYPDELVIVGVHSAKFENEGQTENIRQIVQRYDLHHPVVNDNQFAIWSAYAPYGVQAWPSFVLIDPRGNLLAVQAGEVPFEAFDHVISGMVNYFDNSGELNHDPLPLSLESDQRANTALAFPGKVLADAASSRLFISDSSNNRIIIADLNTYEVLDVIGSGAQGFDDGSFDEASFDKPQGMALNTGNVLYIADIENNAIRAADLAERTVRTVAGTGGLAVYGSGAGPALQTPLSSPWDLALGDRILYIAMAGPHQLWALSLDDNTIYPFVGSGREGLLDGAFAEAQLAQPSGLYYSDGKLYFADSELSSIRLANLRSGQVTTLAGTTVNNLFAFGDVDGPLGTSRLQHALGVVGADDGSLYVADTYNSKIKRLDPETKEISTLFGLGGDGGFRDGGPDLAQFDEPGGLTYANGKLYVADTNNQAVRVIDLANSEVSTIAFPNPEALQIEDRPTVVAGNNSAGLQITLPQQTLAAGEGEIDLTIHLPEGYKLNDLAPFASIWSSQNEAIQIAPEQRSQRLPDPQMPLQVPVTLQEGSDTLRGDLTIYYCEAVKDSLCFVEQVQINAPVVVGTGDSSTIVLDHTIVPPQVATGDL